MNTVVLKDDNDNTFNTVMYPSRHGSEGQELQGYYDTKSNTYYVNLGLNKYIYHLAIVLGLCLVLIAIVILLQ